MVLTLKDLERYKKMSVIERHSEEGKAIRAELEARMRWMPIKWRRLIRCRYILGYGALRTALEIGISTRTVTAWTADLGRWLEDKDQYLNELT